MSKKVIITSPGRCGTTFTIKLLTELGLDTGFPLGRAYRGTKNRDWEWPYGGKNMRKERLPIPYLIKNNYLCRDLNSATDKWDWEIDHVYVLLRSMKGIVDSRWRFHRKPTDPFEPGFETGWTNRTRKDVTSLFTQIAERDLPHTILWYPRLAQDPYYLYRKLDFLMEQEAVPIGKFCRLHTELVQ